MASLHTVKRVRRCRVLGKVGGKSSIVPCLLRIFGNLCPLVLNRVLPKFQILASVFKRTKTKISCGSDPVNQDFLARLLRIRDLLDFLDFDFSGVALKQEFLCRTIPATDSTALIRNSPS